MLVLKGLGILCTAGDYCRPCECSGNINPDDPGSCDSVTGECLRCLNNTFGMACNLCAPGYFGDAIHLKDCQSKDFVDIAVVSASLNFKHYLTTLVLMVFTVSPQLAFLIYSEGFYVG